MDKKLLEILVCPLCKGKLMYNQEKQVLICRFDKLAYPVRHGVPCLMEEAAVTLSSTYQETGYRKQNATNGS